MPRTLHVQHRGAVVPVRQMGLEELTGPTGLFAVKKRLESEAARAELSAREPLEASTLNPQPCTLHPQPSTLHPTPSTLNPAPYTLNPQPCTLHPQPSTLHPAPHTRNPKPCTLHPTPYTPHPTPYTLHLTPCTLNSLNPAGRLWVVGGANGSHGLQDVWSSLDGAAW